MAKHDVVGAGAAVDGLVEVVAHRVLVRQAREIGRVTLLHVVEAERGRTFSRGHCAWCILGAEGLGLRSAVGTGADGHFDPGEQIAGAAGRIVPAGGALAAIQLLPHLVEAMHRARGVALVGERIAVGQLERAGRQAGHRDDALVRRLRGLAGATGQQRLIIAVIQPGFRLLRERQARLALRDRRAAALVGDVGDLGSADQRGRQLIVGEGLLGRAQQKRVLGTDVLCSQLVRLLEVGARNRVLVGVELDDATGEQIVDGVPALLRHVSREHVVEAAILADDDDDVLDRRPRVVIGGGRHAAGKHRAHAELPHRQCTQPDTATIQQT